jgi:hypothetical protein
MAKKGINARRTLHAMFSRVAKDCATAMGHQRAFLLAGLVDSGLGSDGANFWI